MRQYQITEWKDSIDTLRELWQQEPHPDKQRKLHALILLQSGMELDEAASISCVPLLMLQQLIRSYQRMGIYYALGYRVHRESRLTLEQQRALIAHNLQEPFETLADGAAWIAAQFNVNYAVSSIRALFARLGIQTQAQRGRHPLS